MTPHWLLSLPMAGPSSTHVTVAGMTSIFVFLLFSIRSASSSSLLSIAEADGLISMLLFRHWVTSNSLTLWTAAHQASLSSTLSLSLLKLMSTGSVMSSNHLILCHPLLLLPLVLPSIRVFPSELALCIRWPKYWSFSLSISPSSEYSGLISFRIDWLDPLAVQETLSLLQHHNSKASILQHSAFFMAQLSHPHMTTGKTIALTRWTFVSKDLCLCFLICCLGWS